MPKIGRREFGGALAALAAQPWRLDAASGNLTQLLSDSVKRHNIPAAVFLTANAKSVTYSSTHGQRAAATPGALPLDSIFGIALVVSPISAPSGVMGSLNSVTMTLLLLKSVPRPSRSLGMCATGASMPITRSRRIF